MSSKFDRRSFLTQSAATIGGVAMAGSVADGLFANTAGATVGVSSKKPKMGGTLTVGLISDVLSFSNFNGQQASWDQSAFCKGNAFFDPLFVTSANGSAILPMLALSATPNANYTEWTVQLRRGVKFTNGEHFNAAAVVANYAATQVPTSPVGPAIVPIIADVVSTGPYTVVYKLVIPYSTFNIQLSEQQIAYMAAPSTLGANYKGHPIGTGPFEFVSWSLGSSTVVKRNKNYWRKDAKGRQLPYLDGIVFKTIPDDSTRNAALASGEIDMLLTTNAGSIVTLKKMKGISYRDDIHDPRDPAINFIMLNNSGTLNQFGAWDQSALPYIEKGQAVPTPIQDVIAGTAPGIKGAVNPSTLQWDLSLSPVLNDQSIRQACAMAINRETYLKVIALGVGTVSDGIYRKSSPYYTNPNYPAYNPSGASALVQAYKKANNVTTVSFVIDTIADSAVYAEQFAFIQQQLAAVGIMVTPRSIEQAALIQNVEQGSFDAAVFNEFGGIDQGINYVWWDSVPAAPAYPNGLGLTTLPASTFIPGAVNFAHQADPTIEEAMLGALASPKGSAAYAAAWGKVNDIFAQDCTYLFLTQLVTAFAARDKVKNWAYSVGFNGERLLNPDGGSARWDYIWIS
ncbi:MAG: ABC transporter substrate-binding protein [Acidimicrobiales bacterium]